MKNLFPVQRALIFFREIFMSEIPIDKKTKKIDTAKIKFAIVTTDNLGTSKQISIFLVNGDVITIPYSLQLHNQLEEVGVAIYQDTEVKQLSEIKEEYETLSETHKKISEILNPSNRSSKLKR